MTEQRHKRFMNKVSSFFRSSAAELKNLRSLTGLSMCLALGIVLSLIGSIQLSPTMKLSLKFLALAVTGMLYGPIGSSLAGIIIDLLVFVIHPTGPYFPGFTLTSMLSGTLFGLFLYKNKTSLLRLILSKTLINILLNLLLNSLWLTILYHQGFWIMIPGRILKNVALLPLEVFLMWLILPRVAKLAGRYPSHS